MSTKAVVTVQLLCASLLYLQHMCTGQTMSKVTRGILEYRVIRNDSGIDPSYCKTTDRLDKLFHHEVGASVGSATSTRLAAVRSHSRCKNGKC